jgi:hypothetical protein
MATFKCDMKKQFGKFSAHVWKATERPVEPICQNEESAASAAEHVVKAIGKAGFTEGDEVIFRDNAYQSLAELRGVLQRSPY